MVVGLKHSIPFAVQAIPEVTVNGQWLCNTIASDVENLGNTGFCVRRLVTDKHSTNANAFTSLKDLFNSKSKSFFEHPANHGKQIYMFLILLILLKTSKTIY